VPHPPGPVTSLSPATTVGPLLCRRRTTFASHRWATQKPPRRLCPNLPSLSSLCQETGDDPRSWPMKFGCLEWSSKGYRKSDGLWVSGSRLPSLRRSSVCWFRRVPLGFLVSMHRGRLLVFADPGVDFAGIFCRRRPASVAVSDRQRTFRPPESRRNPSCSSLPAWFLLCCPLALLWSSVSHG